MARRLISLVLIFTVTGCRVTQDVTHITFNDHGRVTETRTETLSREDSAKETARAATNTVFSGIAGAAIGAGIIALVGYALYDHYHDQD